jgi:hypothetical protein
MDRIHRHTSGTALVFLFITVILSGCGVEELQPGVIVGDVPGVSLPAGMIVSVGTLDRRAGTYRVMITDESGGYDVPVGLVRLFDTRAEAEQFVRDTHEVLGATARAGANALRVRSGPQTSDDVVYRLRMNEEVTLVAPLDTPVTINGRTGVWYEIIAGASIRGFVFGPLLEGKPGDGVQPENTDLGQNLAAVIDAVGSDPWWSRQSRAAFSGGGLTLETFRAVDGTLVLRTPEEERRLLLSDAVVRYPDMAFPDDGVTLSVRDDRSVEMRISDEGGTRTVPFVPMERYRWNTVWAERQRREAFAKALDDYVGQYRSSTYGDLELHETGHVSWTGSERLSSLGLPSGGARNMEIRYIPRLSAEVRQDYAGGMVLAGGSGSAGPAFLVELLPDAMRLVWLPRFDHTDPEVSSVPVAPLVMYFGKEEFSDVP